ncbi:MAG: hypothetical protein HZB14_10275 [Actinobacteria bacterium]|nr:hypothetical protein [Actinomycetota bacterium]
MHFLPPSGRAQSRAAFAFARGHGFAVWLTLAFVLTLALSLSVFAAGADAKKKRKDKRAPYVTASVTVDSDGDGRVDGVVLTYSEKVRIAKVRKGKGKAKRRNRKKKPWRASRRVTGATLLPGRRRISVQLVEEHDADSADRPSITYIRVPKGAKGVVDRAGNQALTASIKPGDGLPPVPLSAETFDADSDGQLDTLKVTYSETVKDPVAAQFVVSGYAVTGATATGSVVDVAVAEQGVDTDATPTVAAVSGAAKDSNGNEQAVDLSVTAADRAAPAVVDAVTADTNANGRIDRVTVRFSEIVSHAAEAGAGAVSAVGMTNLSSGAAAIDTVVVELNDSGGGYATHLKPDVKTAATAEPVRDTAGNATGASTFKSTRDGAPPLLMSARTRDSDGDGKLDGIVSTFSEPVLYTPDGSLSYFSSTTAQLGTFGPGATATGSTVTAAVNEDSPDTYNSDLPRTSPSVPLPVTYTPPVSGGAVDGAGNPSTTKTVQATDGAGPAIVYAETVDSSPVDGHIDGIKIGFSEPVEFLGGNPFKVASGARIIIDNVGVTTDGTQKVTGETIGQPLYGGVTIPLYPLTTDGTTDGPLADPDGADRPTIDYATISSGGIKTDYAEDAAHNEVIATGSSAFTATVDRVKPVIASMQAADANSDGYVDRLLSTWSEPIATNGAPAFAALSPLNEPISGYTAPTTAAGATADGYALTVILNPASLPDRDMRFETQYVPSGPSDTGVSDAAGNNAATTPSLPSNTASICSDSDERTTLGQDDLPAYADSAPLASAGNDALGTLCGADRDYFSFSATSGQTVKVLLAIAPAALALRAGNSYNPFDAEAPGGGSVSVTTTFDPAVGWTGTFTAGATGTFKIGIGDTESPLTDYGYCISRTDDGSDPTCALSQGDFVITEMLNEVGDLAPDVGPYVELKNVTTDPLTLDSGHKLSVTGVDCALNPYPGTSQTIPAGGLMYVTTVDDPNKTNDFACAALVNGFDLGQPIALTTASGIIDSVDFSGVSIPTTHSIQLRAAAAWESSAANDDLGNGWCVSLDSYGTWGTANNACDEFRLNEVRFLPFDSSRDGQVYVELKGSGAVTPASSMLAGWRIRVKPQGMPGAFFLLPANATPNSSGIFVLADSPASGDTQVPLYSIQTKDVTAGDTANGGAVSGRTLDSYLRADRPVTVKLMRPTGGDPFACETASVDTLGYVPNVVGSQTMTENDGVCGLAFLGSRFMPPTLGYQTDDAIQRDNGYNFQNNNNLDFCATLNSPLQSNFVCFGEV